MNDIVLNKKESIERCIRQIRKYYNQPSVVSFEEDLLRQDAIALNLQRACEQCIDLANYAVKTLKSGLPKESKDSFRLLAENNIISNDISDNLQKMVGFRNVLVHEYQRVDIKRMVDVIENRLDDLLAFVDSVVSYFSEDRQKVQ